MSTRIEWVKNRDGSQGKTWNPVVGCSKVSPGCDHCYAERMAQRLSRIPQTADQYQGLVDDQGWTGETAYNLDTLKKPLHWKKPRRVFPCSMGDLFHEAVPFEFVAAMFGVMAATPQHTYMVLTKRPERMQAWFEWIEGNGRLTFDCSLIGDLTSYAVEEAGSLPLSVLFHHEIWPLPNVWLGVTAEFQELADRRIPLLLQTPAARRFVSCEPLLGPLDLQYSAFNGADSLSALAGIDWVICGAETGPGKRTMQLDWARNVRDDCVKAGVPFFFKRDSSGNRELDGRLWEEWPEVKL